MAPGSLCLTTALAPVPTFLGGSCPLGCSLSAPATGGFSVVSPQYIRYAAGSEKEKRAGGRLHGSTIAQLFGFCNGGGAEASPAAGGRDWGRVVLLWPTPSFSGGSGVACAAIPPAPPSNVFRNRGTPPAPPGGALGSLHPAWGTEGVACSPGASGRFLAFHRVRGWDARGLLVAGGGGWERCEARYSAVIAQS